MVDPPTRFRTWSAKGEAKSPQAQYRTLSDSEIAALPVGHLLARDGILMLWWTWPKLFDAAAILAAWGVRYVSGGAWVKRTKSGKLSVGTGFRLRSSSEPFLIAVNGAPENSRSAKNVIESIGEASALDGIRREHSRKPDEVFAWAESLMPKARRAELFSRQRRPGWETWGDEAGKFDPSTGSGQGEA